MPRDPQFSSLERPYAQRVKATRNHSLEDAVLRYPVKSGSCSSSDGMTAASVTCCSLTLVERREPRAAKNPSRSRPREVCLRMISRSPMSREAKCDVPPFSLPEHRRLSGLLQFSPIVCASPAPQVLDTCAI